MKKLIVAGLVFLACGLSAGEWRPDDRLLDAVRLIESSGGLYLYGDGGRSLGDFQMGRAAWADVNARRRVRGETVYDYNRHVLNPEINRLYAAEYLAILRGQLKRHLRREPTPGELYAAYNMGFRQFSRCGFDLRRVNQTTARKAREITRLVQGLL
jgi:hypothetical protein